MRYRVKWSVSVEHILVWCQKLFLLVCVPHLFLTSNFFAAYEGRLLSNSTLRELSEKIFFKVCSELSEAKKKKYWQNYIASVTQYFISNQEYPKKDRPPLEELSIKVFLLRKWPHTFEKHLYGWKCLSVKTTQAEQVPLHGDRLSGKNYSRGLTSPDSVSEETT